MKTLFLRGWRIALLATTAGAAAVSVAGAAAAPPAPERPREKAAPRTAAAPPVKADRDGDKLFDDFEARLAELAPAERIDVLVRLSAPASAERVKDTARRAGGLAVGLRFGVVDAFSATVTRGQALALTRVPWVVHVEENSPVEATNASAQSSFGVTKARADAPGLDGDGDGSPAAYSKNDLVAAVIDTGIDAAHVELDGGKVLAFKDMVNGRTGAYDDNGHGTHVAATIAGDGAHAGVAPGAALVGVKVLDANGGGTMAGVTAGIEWVVQNKDAYGIEAINLSLGASGCSDGTDTTSAAVNNAVAAGLVVVAAAGNEGPGTCTIGSPAAAAGAVTVGAMSDFGDRGFGLASFSSRGPTADGRVKPDVVAPGVNVTSAQAGTGSGYAAHDGTSMATPFVAGVALLMKDANASLSPQEVKGAIVGTAVDWARGGDNRTAGSTGADVDYGHGRLDAYAALKAGGASLATGPAMPAHALHEGSLAATGAYRDFQLDVTSTAFPVAATLLLPAISGAYAWQPDFDLYLYDPAGRLVARAETVYRQEQVAVTPAVTGTYTLRVYSYSGGGAFLVDVSAPAATPDSTAPTAPEETSTKEYAPAGARIFAGSHSGGSLGSLQADDGDRLEITKKRRDSAADYYAYATIAEQRGSLLRVGVTYDGHASDGDAAVTLSVYDWRAGVWRVVDGPRTGAASDRSFSWSDTASPADYVSSAGEIRFRVRAERSGDTRLRTDLVRFAVES